MKKKQVAKIHDLVKTAVEKGRKNEMRVEPMIGDILVREICESQHHCHDCRMNRVVETLRAMLDRFEDYGCPHCLAQRLIEQLAEESDQTPQEFVTPLTEDEQETD